MNENQTTTGYIRALEEENEALRREVQKYRDTRLPAPRREG